VVRCGLDEPTLARLESGQAQNPTVDILWRYAAALRKRLVLSAEEVPDTRTIPANARSPAPRKTPRKKKTA
jgi:transcriptional regulator with XRE-family HTH domain